DKVDIYMTGNGISKKEVNYLLRSQRDKGFQTQGKGNTVLCIMFSEEINVRIDSYILTLWNSNNLYISNWELQGSNDNNFWSILDKQIEYKFDNPVHFENMYRNDNYYRYIRLIATNNYVINQNRFG